jgi:hypothetical protein
MTYHYPAPESGRQTPLEGLSDEARTALGGLTVGPSPANLLLGLDTGEIGQDFQAVLSTARQDTVRLLTALKYPCNWELVPDLGSKEFEGVNWRKLEQGYAAYKELDLEPSVVFTSEGRPLTYWSALYRNLGTWREKTQPTAAIPFTGLKVQSGLNAEPDIVANWRELIPENARWQVSVIPTVAEAPVQGVNYYGYEQGQDGSLKDELLGIFLKQPNHPGTAKNPFAEMHPTDPHSLFDEIKKTT